AVLIFTRSPLARAVWERYCPASLKIQQGDAKRRRKPMIARTLARSGAFVGALLLAVTAFQPAARAAEIKVMATVAFTPTLDELVPKYQATSGNKITIVYSVIADLKKRIEAGETADVMILSRAALDDLQMQNKVASGSIMNLGRSYVAVG